MHLGAVKEAPVVPRAPDVLQRDVLNEDRARSRSSPGAVVSRHEERVDDICHHYIAKHDVGDEPRSVPVGFDSDPVIAFMHYAALESDISNDTVSDTTYRQAVAELTSDVFGDDVATVAQRSVAPRGTPEYLGEGEGQG